MAKHAHLAIDTNVAYETVEDEVIVIHLEKGHYYSLRGSATIVWNDVIRGLTEQAIVDDILAKFEGDEEEISTATRQFIRELIQEGLILTAPCKEKESSGASLAEATPHERQAFKPPVMEKFTDLEELLLLDPVHEVDDTGWPHRQEGKKQQKHARA